MKKLDKLIISSFIGPFILTFLVVVFILLSQHMLKYFDDIVGKDLGWEVLGELFFYFAIFMTPIAIPLAVLLSSLMTFGNLGEHFELTAIKSAGISLVRALAPIFVFCLFLMVVAFYSNNYFVPKAALEAYSLLYDIKQKKPALDLKEGAFYNGIPNFSIKVNKKFEDGQTLKDVIIYDHRESNGNNTVILADSGKMYTFFNERYLKLELFDGHMYDEKMQTGQQRGRKKETLYRSSFGRNEFIMDLSSFALKDTDESLFASNRIMRNVQQLENDVDSLGLEILTRKAEVFRTMSSSFYYHMREDSIKMPGYLVEHKKKMDSILKANRKDTVKLNSNLVTTSDMALEDVPDEQKSNDKLKGDSAKQTNLRTDTAKINPIRQKAVAVSPSQPITNVDLTSSGRSIQKKRDSLRRASIKAQTKKNRVESIVKDDSMEKEKAKITKKGKQWTMEEVVDSLMNNPPNEISIETSINIMRQNNSKMQSYTQRIERMVYEADVYAVQWHKILANSVAVVIMFLIGAPLGAIIKRGGLGVPVLVSILFFIIFYVISMTGEKYAKQDIVDPVYGIWAANAILFPIGLIFLRQARNDVRLFEADFYKVLFDKIQTWVGKQRKKNIKS